MNSSFSRLSPARSKQERPRVQKIRNCCDACSISKTKCDQTRPSCARCQKHGIDCNYSVSQRKGKPPAASRNPGSAVNARKTPQEKCYTPDSARPSIESPFTDMRSDGVSTPDFRFEQDSTMSDMYLSPFDDIMPSYGQNLMHDMSDCTGSEFMTPNSMFDHELASVGTPHMDRSVSTTSNDNMYSLFPAVSSLASPLEYSFPSPGLPTPPIHSNAHSPSPRYECDKLASSTLESLNVNSHACQFASSTPELSTASFDRILMTNKQAVQNTAELLRCPCSLSQQSNLVISCIVEKVLGLYQSVIRAELYASHVITRLPPSPSTSSDAGERVVSPRPITVGAYRMDAKDEQRMRMQLISNELRETAGLVERYTERYQGMGPRGSGDDMGVQTALIALVKRKLRDTGADLAVAMRNWE